MLKHSWAHTLLYRFMYCTFSSHGHTNSLLLLLSSSSSSSSSSSCSSKKIQKQWEWKNKLWASVSCIFKKTKHSQSEYGVGEGMCFVCVPVCLSLLWCLYCRSVRCIIHQGEVPCAHFLLLVCFSCLFHISSFPYRPCYFVV